MFWEVYNDLLTWDEQPCSLFDRHSLLSEYIYSFTTRDGKIDPQFLTGVASNMLTRFAETSLVIMCLPPISKIRENVSQSKQMEGVKENIFEIYQMYRLLYTMWPNQYKIIRYDYIGESEELQKVFDYCRLHIAECNRKGM